MRIGGGRLAVMGLSANQAQQVSKLDWLGRKCGQRPGNIPSAGLAAVVALVLQLGKPNLTVPAGRMLLTR
jgi:hypothetical protein